MLWKKQSTVKTRKRDGNLDMISTQILVSRVILPAALLKR